MLLKDEKIARELLVEYGMKLLEEDLVQGTWGNLSIRIDDNHFLCTPSGIDYERLGPEDMVLVNIDNLKYEGIRKPTSEKGLHAGIYKKRNGVSAIIHTHSKGCSVFAAAEMPLDVEDEDLAQEIGRGIKVSKYAISGTQKLVNNIIDALGYNSGCIISHHGMICCGENIEDCFLKASKIEEAAARYLDKRLRT